MSEIILYSILLVMFVTLFFLPKIANRIIRYLKIKQINTRVQAIFSHKNPENAMLDLQIIKDNCSKYEIDPSDFGYHVSMRQLESYAEYIANHGRHLRHKIM